MKRQYVSVVGILLGLAAAQNGVAADDVRSEAPEMAKHEASGLVILGGQVTLPGKGVWEMVDATSGQGALLDFVWQPPQEVFEARMGRRGQALQQERRAREHINALRGPYWPLARYARTHEGQFPTFEQLDKNGQESLERAFSSLPALPGRLLDVPSAPHAALVPGAVFEFEKPRHAGHDYVRGTNAAPILVELHPLEDDGKHYVLHANSGLSRVAIDKDLMATIGVTVTPLTPNPAAGQYPETARYKWVAQRGRAGECKLSLSNSLTGAEMDVIVPTEATVSTRADELIREWAESRQGTWDYFAESHDAPGLRTWAWLQRAMLGAKAQPTQRNRRNRRNRGASTDMMGVLGGRAAMRETLQLEALQISHSASTTTVPLASIKGVEVKSHPFEEMLAGTDGGHYPIADLVPHDRFFVGISKPEALLPLLDDGAAFLARVGAGATGRALQYDLKRRYMDALGINDSLVRTLVTKRAIKELALFSPDLFYVDGTEVTAIVRMRGALGVKLLLTVAGISLAEGISPNRIKTAAGGDAWWGLAGELIVMGTSEGEVAAAMALARKDGVGSLGQSAEFRYMLTRVPQTPQTRAYVYFSDPFIRRLVGPEVKIGQVRRLREKATMQTIAYASMLREHDGFGPADSVATLVKSGYLQEDAAPAGITLDENGVPTSATYGPLPEMDAIYAANLSNVSSNEAAAYSAYKENYSRYWRRFFDPIAMCIDEAENQLVATTYILPLLDNSLYDGVRNIVNANPDVPLRVPHLTPQPTGMLSLNLSEKAWQEMLRDGFFRMASQMGLESGALDQLGPAFHFAVFDADPIIAFGSRSLLGLGGQFGDFDDEMMIPLFISLLTRPCAMLVELQDPKPVLSLLADGGLARVFQRLGDDIQFTNYRVAGQDCWVVGADFFGLSLRFSVAVEGNYLVIGNMPWRERIHVGQQTETVVSGASIRVAPSAAKIEQRALHLSATEGQRQAIMEALAYLYPLLASGIAPDAALARHRELFGFTPALPDGTRLNWSGTLPSYAGFGDLLQQAQPPFDPDAIFGALQGVGDASASMQFEDTGLRTIVRWSYKNPAP